ncbi:MAG TPA: hypothetical protein VFC19_45580 [Candidatus Limnocylindrales bacterium]|nr:hypothetical protein [Candidatus Limnocylindrales bacterium]
MRKLALSIVVFAAALLTACGPSAAPALVATAESEALAAMGVEPEDLAAAQPAATPSAQPKEKEKDRKRWDGRRPQKVLLGRNVLHGEAVVQTKEGNVTVVVQRGEVTAISSTSVTVKSTDGFTITWGFHPELRVIERRTTIQPTEIKAGAQIALAGPKSGDKPQARLIVLPLKK